MHFKNTAQKSHTKVVSLYKLVMDFGWACKWGEAGQGGGYVNREKFRNEQILTFD